MGWESLKGREARDGAEGIEQVLALLSRGGERDRKIGRPSAGRRQAVAAYADG